MTQKKPGPHVVRWGEVTQIRSPPGVGEWRRPRTPPGHPPPAAARSRGALQPHGTPPGGVCHDKPPTVPRPVPPRSDGPPSPGALGARRAEKRAPRPRAPPGGPQALPQGGNPPHRVRRGGGPRRRFPREDPPPPLPQRGTPSRPSPPQATSRPVFLRRGGPPPPVSSDGRPPAGFSAPWRPPPRFSADGHPTGPRTGTPRRLRRQGAPSALATEPQLLLPPPPRAAGPLRLPPPRSPPTCRRGPHPGFPPTGDPPAGFSRRGPPPVERIPEGTELLPGAASALSRAPKAGSPGPPDSVQRSSLSDPRLALGGPAPRPTATVSGPRSEVGAPDRRPVSGPLSFLGTGSRGSPGSRFRGSPGTQSPGFLRSWPQSQVLRNPGPPCLCLS
ncbi:proline-rich protein HaeIII subfamily 1-like [Etheostoma spectabile]|uniref:proline-rich protein HaeIII subfamily 1-like n=1 Tax=Etheostoma spectabile TaxID=54343 RepID=UPI0013AE91A7|nr:proline-rich protein HaeIII subfamily 1-like [Etheostoma spectabile]